MKSIPSAAIMRATLPMRAPLNTHILSYPFLSYHIISYPIHTHNIYKHGWTGGLLVPALVSREYNQHSDAPAPAHVHMHAHPRTGGWSSIVAHNAPVMDCGARWCGKQWDIDAAIKAYLDGGVPASKLVLGLASYGRSFKLQNPSVGATPAPWMHRSAGMCNCSPFSRSHNLAHGHPNKLIIVSGGEAIHACSQGKQVGRSQAWAGGALGPIVAQGLPCPTLKL